ncbi:DUF2345 domain-containing protein [Chromohalobacter sp. 11-W]|uniref:DUF2345 domain-containing protein n=1 Tax=Chromohalobacter sp. 11-W TaxID=2994061 RepID=UPI00246901DA|nr:DUF2345 domain-containing protein [Chromohalobacter sp. 11-W]
MKAPWLHLAITASTPASTHLAQGKSLSVASGEDVNIATGKSLLVASTSEKLSLFVQKAGIKLFAAAGETPAGQRRRLRAHQGLAPLAATTHEKRSQILISDSHQRVRLRCQSEASRCSSRVSLR